MNFCRVLTVLMAFLLVTNQGFSQKILVLEKTKRFKRIRHYVGDPFAFRLDDQKFAISGTIDHILDSAVVVDGQLYSFDEISMVLNYKKFAALRGLSKSALYAIPPMFVITLFHRGLNTKEQPLLDRNSLQVMGVVGGIGLLLWPFKARKYNLNKKKWQLRTIDITPG